ncbi:RNA polymerase sigma factor [Planctomycetota bacterium]
MAITDQALQLDDLRDLAGVESVPADQRWIVSTMGRYGHELVTLLWRILGNEQDVCDAYQTTFLQLAHLDGGRKPKQLKAYVFRTASNVAISMIRSKAAARRRADGLAENQRAIQPTLEVDQQELVEKLRYFIGQLPDHLREVIVLRDLVEMPYRRIAQTLGITAGSARVYRCKAMQILAEWMTRPEER